MDSKRFCHLTILTELKQLSNGKRSLEMRICLFSCKCSNRKTFSSQSTRAIHFKRYQSNLRVKHVCGKNNTESKDAAEKKQAHIDG